MASGVGVRDPNLLCVLVNVVSFSQFFDEYLFSWKAIEDFSIKQRVAEFTIETLAVAVLPRVAQLDLRHAVSHCRKSPVPYSLSNELRAFVRANKSWGAHRMNKSVRASITFVEFSC